MSPERVQALAVGRERARLRRDRQAVVTVRAFRAWLVAGGRAGAMPVVPSDAQYRAARAMGEPVSLLDAAA